MRYRLTGLRAAVESGGAEETQASPGAARPGRRAFHALEGIPLKSGLARGPGDRGARGILPGSPACPASRGAGARGAHRDDLPGPDAERSRRLSQGERLPAPGLQAGPPRGPPAPSEGGPAALAPAWLASGLCPSSFRMAALTSWATASPPRSQPPRIRRSASHAALGVH
jgi:hypothetical protein